MKTYIFLFISLLAFLFIQGCSTKVPLKQVLIEKGHKYNVNYKTLHAICMKESSLKPFVVNVNKSIFNIQKGGHYFDNAFSANLYMDTVLDPLNLNYDIGLCQINKIHLKKNNLDNEDMLDFEKNIDMAARIYKYNVRVCKNDVVCALSMYNTGKKNSSVGKKYAQKVLKIRKKLYGN